MSFVKTESNSHWYKLDGTPCYEVPFPEKSKAKAVVEWEKEGKAKGEPRPMKKTTLREARSMNLLPSVTNIISILDKPQLTSWKVEQGIIAALTMTDATVESFEGDLDKLAEQVARDADETKNKAAKFGTAVHNAIEHWIMEDEMPNDAEIRPTFDKFVTWWNDNVTEIYWTEKCLVGDGYAGRGDLKAKIRGRGVCMVDFKTRKADSKGKFASYDEDAMQLAAYREADMFIQPGSDADESGPPAEYCASLYINSLKPEPPTLKVWDEDEIVRYHQAFLAAKTLWQLLKKYSPES